MELEREVQRCGPAFTVRRVLQRLEWGEVTPLEAALIIRVQRTFSACRCRCCSTNTCTDQPCN